MSEGLSLYALLVFLYFTECFVLSGSDDAVVTQSVFGKRQMSSMFALIGSLRKRITLLNPFLPFGLDYLANVPRISLSPAGICSYAAADYLDTHRIRQPETTWFYDDIKHIRADETAVVINGASFVSCSCHEQALQYVNVITHAKSLNSSGREKYLRDVIAQQFSHEKILKEISTVSYHLRWLRRICLLLFAEMFIFAPIAVMFFGLGPMIIPIAVLLYGMALLIAVLYYRAQRKINNNKMGRRIASVIKIILCPPMAVRLPAEISLTSLTKYHPVAVIDTLFGDRGISFYAEAVRKLLHPLKTSSETAAANSIVDWHTETETSACLQYGKNRYRALTGNWSAVPAQERGTQSYCPRCLTQFTTANGTCPDCTGVLLCSFSS